MKSPLVSIKIINYNYGRYLRECFESIFCQTYQNFEISFSDNDSSDNSWDIALEYQRKYPKRINLASNRQNFGPDANLGNCINPSIGKYSVVLCSDDALAPDFIEKCVDVLENNPDCAYVMVHRGIIDDNSNISEEPPFYNQSCIIKGADQAAVYMMAAINPSISQIMYVSNLEALHRVDFSKVLVGRWYGARLLDFILCCNYPVAYLKDPLLLHRIHGDNDSLQAAGNLIEIIGPYILHRQFIDIANSYNVKGIKEKLPAATEKLSQLCLRYCSRFLINGDQDIAEQYFHLAAALSIKIKNDKIFSKINSFFSSNKDRKKKIIAELKKESNLITRKISYDPPQGSMKI